MCHLVQATAIALARLPIGHDHSVGTCYVLREMINKGHFPLHAECLSALS